MSHPTTPQREEEILASWEAKQIFAKTVAKPAPAGNFVFFEGPPTANGAPGIHHALSRVFKDIIPRYKTMRGYHVERKAGWDTHGLPVEIQVEKKLGIKSKTEIENIVPGDASASIRTFNAECKEMVWQFKQEWDKFTHRLAFWLDLEHPYVTYDNSYIESVWQVIAKAHERGLLHRGHRVVPFCTRCGTSLSSHELAQGYKEVTDKSVFVKFKVTKGQNGVEAGDAILSWTTTPWTLPGNVALAVGAEIMYARVQMEIDGQSCFVILAKDLVAQVLGEDVTVMHEIIGQDLVGIEYEPLFPGALGKDETPRRVVPADFVTTTDGTGVVHTAVMYGEDDYRLGEQVGLPKVHTVDQIGKFLPQVGELAGMYVKSAKTEEAIFKHLETNGNLLRIVPFTHDYPHCWRCSTPLLYYAMDSWFVAMTTIKDELLHNANQINWTPEHIKEGRFGEWLRNVKDWNVSRDRYWGTPLPIWVCQIGNSNIQNTNNKQDPRLTSHDSRLTTGCGRFEVVASISEIEQRSGVKLDDVHRPFIDEVTMPCSCGGTMTRVSAVCDVWLDSGAMPFAQHHYPFENKELVDNGTQYPADYISEAIDQTRGWFYTLLAVSTIMGKGTSYKNVICLGHINDAQGQKMSKSKGNIIEPWQVMNSVGVDALRWYVVTINQPGDSKNFDLKGLQEVSRKPLDLLRNVVAFYKLYATTAAPTTEPTVTNVLDRWVLSYLAQVTAQVSDHLDHYRVLEAARALETFVDELSTWYVRRSRDRFKDDEKDEAVATLGYVLLQVAKLMAPFTPYIAEDVYAAAGGDLESVHLADWPVVGQTDAQLMSDMQVVRAIVEQGLAARSEAGIKIRQPLQRYSHPQATAVTAELLSIIAVELNVKEVVPGESKLDTELSPELQAEGIAREFVRQINSVRKDMDLTRTDRIVITYRTDDAEIVAALQLPAMVDYICKNTLADSVATGAGDVAVEVNKKEVRVQVEKV